MTALELIKELLKTQETHGLNAVVIIVPKKGSKYSSFKVLDNKDSGWIEIVQD